MEEQKSIFQSKLSFESNSLLFSAGKWSKFLGITFIVASVIMLLAVASIGFFSNEQFSESMELAFASNPQLSMFQNVPKIAFILGVSLVFVMMIFLGVLFYKVGKHSAAYFISNDEGAFVDTFQSAKKLFLVYSILTILGIVFSLVSLISQLLN